MKIKSVVTIALCCFAVPSIRAEEPAKKWKNVAEGSFVNTNGNSKTTTTSAKNLFTYAFSGVTKLDVEAGALGARSQGLVTAEQYFTSEKVEQKISDRNYLFERYRWDKDRFARIANRHDASVGIGRDIWKTAKDLFSMELGPGYMNEERIKDVDTLDEGLVSVGVKLALEGDFRYWQSIMERRYGKVKDH
jgi:putative salt-induced outer membrane protein YdiY